MTHSEIREKFLKFFQERGHKIVPSSSLLPENDPTTLFTGSGMQPMMPYLLGERHPLGKRIADSQKSFRAEDIEEIGDNRHTTFFEMLGNWSFGDYWKEEQLNWIFDFLTSEVGLNPHRLYVTVFSGGAGISRDDESIAIWQKIFQSRNISIKYALLDTLSEASRRGINEDERIFGYGVEKNWWSRAGEPENMPAGEPGGPDSEIFYDFGTPHDPKYGDRCHPNCDCGRFLEIGNSVFMEYRKKADGDFEKLTQRNVDFGGGLERIAAAAQNQSDIFMTDTFESLRKLMPTKIVENVEVARIMMDHSRAIAFLISDGLRPSNKDKGYVLRRLIRRAMAHFHQASFGSFAGADILGQDFVDIENLLSAVIDQYNATYPELSKELVLKVFSEENTKYRHALNNGIRELKKIDTPIDAKMAFRLFESYGLTFEIIKDFAGDKASILDRKLFDEEFRKHQEISRAGAEKKFGGHGLLMDTGELKAGNEEELKKATRLHTATHLLHAALRKIFGEEVKQQGSDITPERLRFDFTFPRKLTPEEIQQVEDMVNDAIKKELPVTKTEMPYEDAIKSGALAFFKQKYPEKVNVYTIGDFSKELCGGPHVSNTLEIGRFRIVKEESISAGVRRIRAVVE